jgi:hypothetical protein
MPGWRAYESGSRSGTNQLAQVIGSSTRLNV